jgi:hypothetical protein
MVNKLELLERWRREGREQEAAAYRDDVRRRLRAEGKPRQQAKAAAWAAAAEKFPPLALSDDSLDELADDVAYFAVDRICEWEEQNAVELDADQWARVVADITLGLQRAIMTPGSTGT